MKTEVGTGCVWGGRDREDVHDGVGVCRVHVVRGLVILLSNPRVSINPCSYACVWKLCGLRGVTISVVIIIL